MLWIRITSTEIGIEWSLLSPINRLKVSEKSSFDLKADIGNVTSNKNLGLNSILQFFSFTFNNVEQGDLGINRTPFAESETSKSRFR